MKTTNKKNCKKLCNSCKCAHDSVLPDCMVCRALSMIVVTAGYMEASHQEKRSTESSNAS